MGQFEETLQSGGTEELNQLKQWLFQENIRVEIEKKELLAMQQKFMREREQFQEEMRTLNQQILAQRKRLKEDNTFFDKKMDILKNGFEALEQDRKKFEKEKARYRIETSYETAETGEMFFKGVHNPLTLKKRYKDLIKIFHPDNVCGDHDTIQAINREYEQLRSELIKKDYPAG